MSYIHEALKKAQEIKNRGIGPDIGRSGRVVPGGERRYLARLLPVACLLFLFAAAAGVTWLKPGEVPAPLPPVISPSGPGGGETSEFRETPHPSPPPADIKASPAPDPVEKVPSSSAGGGELYGKALRAQQSDDLAGAEALYRRILKENPHFADGLNNLGVLLMARGEPGEAERMFRRAVAADGRKADSYYNMACLCSLQGRIGEGLQYLEKAASLKKDVKSWAKDDKDLENLRSHEGFGRIAGD